MPMEKTQTKGVYKIPGKKGITYLAMVYVKVRDPLAESGERLKLKGKHFKRYADAVDFKLKARSELKQGIHAELTDKTVEEVANDWLAEQKRDWRIQTYNNHAIQVKNHIVPLLGHIRAARLSARAIKAASVEWQKVLGVKCINGLYATLNRICRYGMMEYDFKTNPMTKVNRLKNRPAPQQQELAQGEIADRGRDAPEQKLGINRPVRSDEVLGPLELKNLFIQARQGYERVLIMLAALTGARHGELCGLRWSTVDLPAGKITINRSLTRHKGGFVLEEPKSKAAFRTFDLPAGLVAELSRWKSKCESTPNPNDLVLVNELGQPLHRSENNIILKAVCERAKVPPITMHNLRHSFASNHLNEGTPLLEVSAMLGHSNPSITLSVYSHWTKREKSNSQANLLKRIFAAVERPEQKKKAVG